MILSMGATHIDRDKLAKIVNIIQSERVFMRTGIRPMDVISNKLINESDRCMELYGTRNIGLMRVKYVPEVKYDGYSYLFSDGEFYSRNLSTAKGNEGSPICKSEWIPHLWGYLRGLYNSYGIDFQGELFYPDGTSDDVTTIMGCTQDEAIKRQLTRGKLHYMLVDIRKFMGINVMHEPYYVRRALLEHVYSFMTLQMKEFIHISEIMPDAISSFRMIVSNGGEGLVIKDTSRIYVPDKKPAGTWIKCKKEVTFDCTILDFNNNGTGKNKDLFGSMVVGMFDSNGKMVEVANVSSGIPDQLRIEMSLNREEYRGKVVEVSAMQPNPKKLSFRHPRFVRLRPDKQQSDCDINGITVNTEII